MRSKGIVEMQAVEHEMQLGHCFSHNLHSHTQTRSANLIGIAHHQYPRQDMHTPPDTLTGAYTSAKLQVELFSTFPVEP
jgi:hypothetical protein